MRRLVPALATGGVLLAALALPGTAFAQDSWDGPVPVRVRHFEGGVTVQRVQSGETGEALINLPLDAGDRLWTGEDGRVELVLDDGTLLWLDAQSTLDVVSLATAGRSGETLLRLWNGSAIVARRDGYGVLRVDSPEASILVAGDTLARIDVETGRSFLSVLDGRAELQAGGLVERVSAGQRSYAETGTAPAEPVAFNTAARDGFDAWYTQRISDLSRTVEHVRRERDYVPREVVHYAADLEPHGSWYYHSDFGAWAWRPRVTVGWAPYRHGRWVYAYGGWTWVSSSPWGWVTSHYGRWHHVGASGWVWFPGRVYSPGWVSWYVGTGYVGWCPIGYYDRPLVSVNLWLGGHRGYGYDYHGRSRGYAVPRGTVVAGRGYTRDEPGGWTFARNDDLGRPDQARATVDRTAVQRGTSEGSVTLQGPLRPRDPRTLVAGAGSRVAVPRTATPQLGGGSGGATTAPRVAVSRSLPSTPAARPGDRPAVTVGGGNGNGVPAPRVAVPRGGSTLPSPTPRPSVGRQGPVARPRPDGGGSGGPAVAPRPGGEVRAPTIRPGGSTAVPRSGILPRPGTDGGPTVAPRPGPVVRPAPRGTGVPMPRPASGGSTVVRPPTSGIARPPSSIARPPSSAIARPASGGIARPPSTGIARPPSSGIARPPKHGPAAGLGASRRHPPAHATFRWDHPSTGAHERTEAERRAAPGPQGEAQAEAQAEGRR